MDFYTETTFDFIIIGGGAAGLSMAMELAPSGKSILVIDKERKEQNDRTWSYWEKDSGKYDEIISHAWPKINFYAHISKEQINIDPYKYKMIRSADFYQFAYSKLKALDHVHFIQDEVSKIDEQLELVSIFCQSGSIFKANLVLDSITIPRIDTKNNLTVLQHFGGWFIKANNPSFSQETATFMDFRIDQNGETRFFYVLPTSETEALVEIAVFSNIPWKKEDYDRHIQHYIKDYLKIENYTVEEEELGIIPMTSYPFQKHNTKRIIRIGTAGGWVKPSSGYAFKRIVQKSELLAHQLLNGLPINVESPLRYKWMDKTMLKAMLKNYVSGKDIFDSLFSKRSAEEIFQFLDEENSIFKDLIVMYSAPIIPFTRAAFSLPL